jgi:hypothetical protein
MGKLLSSIKAVIIGFIGLTFLAISPLCSLTYTVGYGGGYDYPPEEMQEAINDLLANATPQDTLAFLQIGPGSYTTESGYDINMEATNAVSLTIESTGVATTCSLTANPPSNQGEFGRLFQICGNSQRDIIFKNLSMYYDGDHNSIIFVEHSEGVSLPRVLDISGCVFTYKRQAIDLYDQHDEANSQVNILNNQFICTANYANQEFSIEAVKYEASATGSSINLLLEGNIFSNSGCPLSAEARQVDAHIRNNQFINLIPSFVQVNNAPLIIINDLDSGANSSMLFEDNLLLNVGLCINSIDSLIKENRFWITDNYGQNYQNYCNLICSNWVIMGNSLPTPYIEMDVRENFFYSTPSWFNNINLMSAEGNWVGALTLSFSHNTFFSPGEALRIEYANSVPQHCVSLFRDNLVCCDDIPFTFVNLGIDPLLSSFLAEYSVFENGYPSVTEGYDIDLNSCYSGDPYLTINETNHDYQLQWTYILKSPCINTGYPGEENELTDPDGTPPDIGCFYYPHYHEEYFERYNPAGIYWLSFPVVDDRTYIDGEYWNELGFLFEDNMGVPPDSQLDNVSWSYDGEPLIMKYSGGQWQNSFERVFQPKGYKAQFNTSFQLAPVTVNGFKASASQTPVLWQVEVNEQLNEQLFDNWIGYFAPYTQTVSDAFSELVPGSERTTYLDHVYSIKTQTWGTSRTDYQYGSPWLVDPKQYTLSEGEMLDLRLLPDAPEEMYWNTFSTPTESVVRETPTAFSYEEKLDYTPVFVEFDPDDLPDEVGLYVDGQCLGAAVVDSTLVEVNLYPEPAKESGELCVMFYYEGKGKQAAPGWRLYDPARLVFAAQPLRMADLGDYAYLSYRRKEGDSLLPLATSLQQNYPNPFNPSTTISFILAGEMDARLEVYNLRGQKVRTLHNGKLAKGKHYLVWNGRDEQNSPVSSGIYFSRLTTPNGSFVNKMMLMK